MRWAHTVLVIVAMTAVGCDQDATVQAAGEDGFQDDDVPAPAAEDSFQDDDIPMGGCNTGTGGCPSGTAGDDGAAIGDPCDDTVQCSGNGVCVAPFDAGAPGTLVCRVSCVELDDASSWCSDDASCCSGVCGPRGLCLPDEAGADETAESGDMTGAGDTTAGDTTADGGATG